MEIHKAGFTILRINKYLNIPKSQVELIEEVMELLKPFIDSIPCPEYALPVGKLTKFIAGPKFLTCGYEFSIVPQKNFKE